MNIHSQGERRDKHQGLKFEIRVSPSRDIRKTRGSITKIHRLPTRPHSLLSSFILFFLSSCEYAPFASFFFLLFFSIFLACFITRVWILDFTLPDAFNKCFNKKFEKLILNLQKKNKWTSWLTFAGWLYSYKTRWEGRTIYRTAQLSKRRFRIDRDSTTCCDTVIIFSLVFFQTSKIYPLFRNFRNWCAYFTHWLSFASLVR